MDTPTPDTQEDDIIRDILGSPGGSAAVDEQPDTLARLFLAVPVPVGIGASLKPLGEKHYAQYLKSWVPPQAWHVTLLFLGEVRNHSQYMGRLTQPLGLSFVPTVQITHIGRGLVRDQLWAYALNTSALEHLRKALAERLKTIRWPLPLNDYDRFTLQPFAPHIRLATFYPMIRPIGIADYPAPSTFTIPHVHLFQSRLSTDKPPVYELEGTIPVA